MYSDNITTLAQSSGQNLGALQIGPDGQIYASIVGASQVGQIQAALTATAAPTVLTDHKQVAPMDWAYPPLFKTLEAVSLSRDWKGQIDYVWQMEKHWAHLKEVENPILTVIFGPLRILMGMRSTLLEVSVKISKPWNTL
ncbi:hypothetical protein QWY93_18835 [Echinicola jeungdonensis]|uniref:hypothetical protein n=1 Tax=Echinicola jeungdonensis TaxID=709343 RepID=UPI0025B2B608|nr:hypothetical protein [Echinicola jeungdonensis]MDN3671328.1 hypothetical protein [Echinicola jeungdonensis]